MPPGESRFDNSHAEFLRRLERKRLPFVYKPTEAECSAFYAGLRETEFKRQNDADYRVGVCSSQGKRDKMEDFYSVDRIDLSGGRPAQILGLYDGHGGRGCAQFVSIYMPRFIAQSTQEHEDLSNALRHAYAVAESRWLESTPMDPSGTTSVSIVFCEGEMHVAHVGDSRAVLCRDGIAVRLTDDHKPDVGAERQAIMARGGVVTYPDRRTGRVDGNLAISRTLGDRQWKPHVSPEPDTSCHPLSEDDEFVIIATDGLWDVLSDQAAVDAVKSMHSPAKMAKALVEQAFCKGSLDNITVLVALLRSAPPQPPTPQSLAACGTASSSTSQSSKRSREKPSRSESREKNAPERSSSRSEQRDKSVDSPTAAYIRKIGARRSFKPDPERPKKAPKDKAPASSTNASNSVSKSSFACAPLDLRFMPSAAPQQSHPALHAQSVNTSSAEHLLVASRECTPPDKSAAKKSPTPRSSEKKSAEKKSAERKVSLKRSDSVTSARKEQGHRRKKSLHSGGGVNTKVAGTKSVSQMDQSAEVPDLATGIQAGAKSLQGWSLPPFATAFSKSSSLPPDAAPVERKASSTRKKAKDDARKSVAAAQAAAESPNSVDARCKVTTKPKNATPELGESCDSSPSDATFSKRSASHTQRRSSTSDEAGTHKAATPPQKSQPAGNGKLAQVVQPDGPQSSDTAAAPPPARKPAQAQTAKEQGAHAAQPSFFARLFCCAGSSVEAGGPMDGYNGLPPTGTHTSTTTSKRA